MTKIVLANKSYQTHMTSEGNELQLGLQHHGWILVGNGYDNLTNIPDILSHYKPDVILIQDKRDWDRNHPGSFGNPNLHFDNIHVLRHQPDITKICVFKDAGSCLPYQYEHFKNVQADALLTYYHCKAIDKLNPGLPYEYIRTYHSVDKDVINKLQSVPRKDKAVISGALGKYVYPQRTDLMLTATNHMTNGCLDAYTHPGYSPDRPMTNEYLQMLLGYKVSIATCSQYQFALRKIIEALACGCIPLTNLPIWDELPVVDKYLKRFSKSDRTEQIVRQAEVLIDEYDPEVIKQQINDTLEYYDYRNLTGILNTTIEEFHKTRINKGGI